MEYGEASRPARSRFFRAIIALLAVFLVPPFLVLAVAPMLLMLTPVALIGITFILPAMLSSSLAARSEERQRASVRPKSMRHPVRAMQ